MVLKALTGYLRFLIGPSAQSGCNLRNEYLPFAFRPIPPTNCLLALLYRHNRVANAPRSRCWLLLRVNGDWSSHAALDEVKEQLNSLRAARYLVCKVRRPKWSVNAITGKQRGSESHLARHPPLRFVSELKLVYELALDRLDDFQNQQLKAIIFKRFKASNSAVRKLTFRTA